MRLWSKVILLFYFLNCENKFCGVLCNPEWKRKKLIYHEERKLRGGSFNPLYCYSLFGVLSLGQWTLGWRWKHWYAELWPLFTQGMPLVFWGRWTPHIVWLNSTCSGSGVSFPIIERHESWFWRWIVEAARLSRPPGFPSLWRHSGLVQLAGDRRADPRDAGRDCISHLAWEPLRTPRRLWRMWLKRVDVWVMLPRLLPPQTGLMQV